MMSRRGEIRVGEGGLWLQEPSDVGPGGAIGDLIGVFVALKCEGG